MAFPTKKPAVNQSQQGLLQVLSGLFHDPKKLKQYRVISICCANSFLFAVTSPEQAPLSSYQQKIPILNFRIGITRGPERIRTAVDGFADHCLAARPQDPFPFRGNKDNKFAFKLTFNNYGHLFDGSINRGVEFSNLNNTLDGRRKSGLESL